MTYQMNEAQLNNTVQKMYQRQVVGSGAVGMNETTHDDSHRNPTKNNMEFTSYFARLLKLANQVDSERAAQSAMQKGFESMDFLSLAKLEIIFSKRENQNTVSYGEYKVMKDEFIRRFGNRPDLTVVRKIMSEKKSSRIKYLESLL